MAGSVGSDGCDVNMTPLLDLVLQLIMFFMITINFVKSEKISEEVTLPTATHATPLDQDASKFIYLNLNREGKFVVGLGKAALETPGQVREFLDDKRRGFEKDHVESGSAQPLKIIVVLRADENARYSRVWEVLDASKRSGFQHWQLRVLTGGPARPAAPKAAE